MQLWKPRFYRGIAPGGAPRVDWSSPLTNGLAACFVPGSYSIDNLAPTPVRLNFSSAAKMVPTFLGPGMTSLAANGGAYATLPATLKLTGNVTLFWLGIINGFTPDTPYFIGTSPNQTGAAPFLGYAIGAAGTNAGGSDGLATLWSNNAGTFANANFAGAYASGDFGLKTSFAGTFLIGGTSTLYKNGKSVGTSTAFTSSPTYSAAGYIGLGTDPNNLAVHINSWTLLGLIYNRALAVSEILSLDADPFQFLIYPEDDIFAELVGTATATFKPGWATSATRIISGAFQ